MKRILNTKYFLSKYWLFTKWLSTLNFLHSQLSFGKTKQDWRYKNYSELIDGIWILFKKISTEIIRKKRLSNTTPKLSELRAVRMSYPITNSVRRINNGNRTEWSPLRSVIIRAINNFNNLSITSMITYRIGRHEVPLPINHNLYNFRKSQCIYHIHLRWKQCLKLKILHFGNSPFFSWISGCCYGYCDRFCDWSIKPSGLSVIDCFNYPITANCPITLSDYNCKEWQVKN